MTASLEKRNAVARVYGLAQDAVAKRKIPWRAFTFFQLLVRTSREEGTPGLVACTGRQMEARFRVTRKTLIGYRRALEKAGLITYTVTRKWGCVTQAHIEIPALSPTFFSGPDGSNNYTRDGSKNYTRDGSKNYSAPYIDVLPTGVGTPQDNVSTSRAGRGHRVESSSAGDGLAEGGGEALRRGQVPPRGGGFGGAGRSVAQEERKRVLKRLRQLLGAEEMHQNGGIWALRLKEDADGLLGLIGDLEDRMRAGKSPRNKAAWCEKVWRDSHAHSVRNPVPE